MTSRTASTRSVLTRVARWVALAATVLVAVWAWPASLGGCTTFVLVTGGSMEPTYATGDLLVARCGEVAVGDVVVYEPPTAAGSLVVHRIVGGDPSAWVLQGDANDWLDPWTPGQEHVVGRVVAHVPGLGLAPWVLDPLVWASVIVAGLGVWLWPSRPSREGAASPDAGGPPEADGPALDAGAAPGAAGARRSWRHRAAAGTAGAAVVALLAVAAVPAPASAARVAVDAAGLAVRTQEVDLPAPAALPAICATSRGDLPCEADVTVHSVWDGGFDIEIVVRDTRTNGATDRVPWTLTVDLSVPPFPGAPAGLASDGAQLATPCADLPSSCSSGSPPGGPTTPTSGPATPAGSRCAACRRPATCPSAADDGQRTRTATTGHCTGKDSAHPPWTQTSTPAPSTRASASSRLPSAPTTAGSPRSSHMPS